MDFFRAHLLSIITYTPLVGALVLLLPPFKGKDDAVRWFANVVGVVGFLVSLPLWFWFDPNHPKPFQFEERFDWIKGIGVQYYFGVDGISILLILLTTLLGAIAILSSWTAITDRVRQFYVFLLLLQTGMLGVFCAIDMFLFYVFWEVMLVPMYFLIGIWGGARRLYAAIKFFLYTLVGSVVMLLGILALYFHAKRTLPAFAETGTFDVTQWYAMGIPGDLQWWVFAAFALGFAIKVPMFPFHTWLPDAHVEAPTAGSVILAGVLLKMGTYGFIRFSLPLLPDATRQWVPIMVTLSIIGIVYAALVTLVQKDMKKLIAYSSVSHLGFCMLGMFALNPLGIEGSILQMINHGLSTGGLFLIVGLIYERRHTKEIAQFGGLAHVMPVYATLTLIIFLASMGLPTLNGFIGELMILQGAFAANKVWAYWAVSGVVLGAAYLLWLYQRVFWGKITSEENKHLVDLNAREIATLVPLVALCFWIGLYPEPFLKFIDGPSQRLAAIVQPDVFGTVHAAGTTAAPAATPVEEPPILPEGASPSPH
jgi:NADH-quinone oxidoreductase subunit M